MIVYENGRAIYPPEKLHWCKERWTSKDGYQINTAMCGKIHRKFANAKRKVTCLNCLKAMGVKK